MSSAYSRPLLIHRNNNSEQLERLPLSGLASSSYDEAWLQRLLFANPECIPVAELDSAYSDLVPIAMEVATDAGPIDVLYATPRGRLVVLEAKLWRNAEARRKVIAQVLDYANALAKTDYQEFDGKIKAARAALGSGKEDGLADIVRKRFPSVEEATFIDGVMRSMRRGEFLLLIAGDGIREGAGQIAEFLQQHGTLHFSFGLIEMAIYALADGSRLVQPRVVAQSQIIQRIVVSMDGHQAVVSYEKRDEEEGEGQTRDVSPQLAETRRQFSEFWGEFLRIFAPRLRDQSQPLPSGSRSQNLYFYLPKPADGWISAYVAQSQGEVGVYLTFARGPIADRIYAGLLADRELIESEMDCPLEWSSEHGKHMIVLSKAYAGVILTDHRSEVIEWMAEYVNRFISSFRGRAKKLADVE